jgi:hypothetical protein
LWRGVSIWETSAATPNCRSSDPEIQSTLSRKEHIWILTDDRKGSDRPRLCSLLAHWWLAQVFIGRSLTRWRYSCSLPQMYVCFADCSPAAHGKPTGRPVCSRQERASIWSKAAQGHC